MTLHIVVLVHTQSWGDRTQTAQLQRCSSNGNYFWPLKKLRMPVGALEIPKATINGCAEEFAV